MAWQFYAIIFVTFLGISHLVINLGINKINQLKTYFIKHKIPLIFDEIWVKDDLLKIKYINISDQKIVGFNMIIEIEKKDGEKELIDYYVDKLESPIKMFINKTFTLYVPISENEKIINTYTTKVLFLDGSFWKLKKIK